MVKLSLQIKRARKRLKLPMRDVAERSGISHTYIMQIERGERIPTDDILAKLASTLELDEAELFAAAGRVSPKVKAAFLNDPHGTEGKVS